MQRVRYAFVVFATAMLVGCAGVRPPSQASSPPPADSRFGFDPVGGEPEWRVGDSVVFEITAFDGTAESRFYVDCEVKPQPDEAHWPADLPRGGSHAMRLGVPPNAKGKKSPVAWVTWRSALVDVQLRDADFHVTGPTEFVLPMEVFEQGSYEVLRLLETTDLESGDPIPQAMQVELARSACIISVTLSTYGQLLTHPDIRDFATTIVRKGIHPNPLLLIGMKGYSINTDLPEGMVEADVRSLSLPDGIDDALAYEATCLLQTPFGEKPICILTITTVPPLPPLHVSGGVVMVEAKPLKTSKRWFRIKLVSAKRGTGAVVQSKKATDKQNAEGETKDRR